MIFTITPVGRYYQVDVYLSPTDLKNSHVHKACGFTTREDARIYGEWWIRDE